MSVCVHAGDIDTSLVVLKFANGVIGTISNSRKATYGYDQVSTARCESACASRCLRGVAASMAHCALGVVWVCVPAARGDLRVEGHGAEQEPVRQRVRHEHGRVGAPGPAPQLLHGQVTHTRLHVQISAVV